MKRALTLCLSLLAAGCTHLLPRGTSDTPSPFTEYRQARAAVDRVVPFRTRVADLPALGLDPEEGRNVTRIPYPDIVARLAPHSGVPLDSLDAGVRACILARTACQGWRFRFERLDRRREGDFWPDFLNVRRVTHVTGWWFEALVVASDGTVLFVNHGGEARIDRVERQTNPLGPFQPAGEGLGALVIR